MLGRALSSTLPYLTSPYLMPMLFVQPQVPLSFDCRAPALRRCVAETCDAKDADGFAQAHNKESFGAMDMKVTVKDEAWCW